MRVAHFHGQHTWSSYLRSVSRHVGEAMWEETKAKLFQNEGSAHAKILKDEIM